MVTKPEFLGALQQSPWGNTRAKQGHNSSLSTVLGGFWRMSKPVAWRRPCRDHARTTIGAQVGGADPTLRTPRMGAQ
eukprot:12880306-Prorocentrum_lima.AAC.1